MTESIYHAVPPKVVGNILYPLNQLREVAPDAYAREMSKYQDHPDRMRLPETHLSALDCLWNDVIHCSPIHPHFLYKEWLRHGASIDPDRTFFRVPIEHVAHLQIAIMCKRGKDRNVDLITADEYTETKVVPKETREWYARLAGQGRSGADFVGVPHVLVKGAIDISHVETIRWSSKPSR